MLKRTISQLNSTEKMSTAVESEHPLLTDGFPCQSAPGLRRSQVLIEVRYVFFGAKVTSDVDPPQGELYAPRLEPLLDRFAFLAQTLLDPTDHFVQASFGLHHVIVRNLTPFPLDLTGKLFEFSFHLVAVFIRVAPGSDTSAAR
jgi:hypothetical protein